MIAVALAVTAIFAALRVGFSARARSVRAAAGVCAVHALFAGAAVYWGCARGAGACLLALATAACAGGVVVGARGDRPTGRRVDGVGPAAFAAFACAAVGADVLALSLSGAGREFADRALAAVASVACLGPVFWREMNAEHEAPAARPAPVARNDARRAGRSP